MFPDYYKRLGLTKSSTKNEIKKAFRVLALKFHPDKNNSPDAAEKFISINEAYLILFDDIARLKYDKEYDIHYSTKNEPKQSSKSNYEYSGFNDEELNDWAKKARQQGNEYAKMAFAEFSKLIIGFIKETGFQLTNTLILFFGLLLTISGFGNILIGIFTTGNIGTPILGIILMPIGILFWRFANKNWREKK